MKRSRVTGPNAAELARETERDVEALQRATRTAIEQAVEGAKRDIRALVEAAGLGRRLPRAIRGVVYPKSGLAMRPAGEIHVDSKSAIRIFDAFLNGTEIKGRQGQHLAIPTENVPRVGRGGGTPMSPAEVVAAFGPLRSIPTGNRRAPFVLAVQAVEARSGRGYRRATGRRLQQGRAAQLTVMFVLVDKVMLPKRLDPDAIAAEWGDRIGEFTLRALP